MKTGLELIVAERKRQIEVEGWSAEHDECHNDGDLLSAGLSYGLDAFVNAGSCYPTMIKKIRNLSEEIWPWDEKWWKPTPKDTVRQLTKAGALIAAEIDRIQREQGA